MNLQELRKYAGEDVAQDAMSDLASEIETRDEIIESLRAQIVAQAQELAKTERLQAALQAFVDLAPSTGARCLDCGERVYGGDESGDHSPECAMVKAREALDRADCEICRTLNRQGNPSRCCARWNPLMVSRGGVSDAGGADRKSSHAAHRVTVCANCGQFRVSGHVDDQWFSVTFELHSEETLNAAGMPLRKDDCGLDRQEQGSRARDEVR